MKCLNAFTRLSFNFRKHNVDSLDIMDMQNCASLRPIDKPWTQTWFLRKSAGQKKWLKSYQCDYKHIVKTLVKQLSWRYAASNFKQLHYYYCYVMLAPDNWQHVVYSCFLDLMFGTSQLSMGWLTGKSTRNHRFSHEIWDFPVIEPINWKLLSWVNGASISSIVSTVYYSDSKDWYAGSF